MKVRNGFVSNSSSSSFLIYGASLSDSVARKKLSLGEKMFPREEIEERFDHDKRIRVHHDSDNGVFYIGASWDSVGDDETGKQFKDSVEAALKKVFGDDIEFGTFEEAWYDG